MRTAPTVGGWRTVLWAHLDWPLIADCAGWRAGLAVRHSPINVQWFKPLLVSPVVILLEDIKGWVNLTHSYHTDQQAKPQVRIISLICLRTTALFTTLEHILYGRMVLCEIKKYWCLFEHNLLQWIFVCISQFHWTKKFQASLQHANPLSFVRLILAPRESSSGVYPLLCHEDEVT